MLKCPMCRELLPDNTRKCRKCQTDLSLLADYVSHLQEGLVQAEAMTKSGHLDGAVWAYLAVLEVDPDNATARRQVGKVATAVRQFDRTAPGRRWLRALQKETWFQRWRLSWGEGEGSGVWGWVFLFLLYFGSVVTAYYWGVQAGRQVPAETRPEETRPEETKPGEKKPAEKEKRSEERSLR
jgi:hypothetical protein